MNLDILRTEWAARDQKLESALRLNTRLLLDAFVEKGRAEIVRRNDFGVISTLIWVATLIGLGLFMAKHVGDMRFFLPAALLLAWTIATGVTALLQRTAMRDLDFSRPLLEVQRELERLRIQRLQAFKWSFLTGQVLWWIPFTIVVTRAMGVNLYASEWMRQFMVINIAVGLLAIPVAIWVSRRVAGRFAGSKALASFTDAIAGRDVVAARDFLGKLSRFETD
jgi:hypothetical protein